jgi:hydrogenase expression/formation protein HypD
VQLEAGRAELDNAYSRVVTERGNEAAQAVLAEVFEPVDRAWRGIGVIPQSGWRLAKAYREYDAEERFPVAEITAAESPLCRAGEVLKGALKPNQCPAFGRECTPRTPLGATMVSSEGACAAYFNAGRFTITTPQSPSLRLGACMRRSPGLRLGACMKRSPGLRLGALMRRSRCAGCMAITTGR